MAKVREQYWVPRLRRLTKRVVKNCLGCRRFQVQAFSSPPQGTLPKDRIEGQTPFQVVGVNYAGPFKYRKGAKTEGISRYTPDSCLVLGFVTQSGNYRVPRKFQAFHCPEGITPKGVFR